MTRASAVSSAEEVARRNGAGSPPDAITHTCVTHLCVTHGCVIELTSPGRLPRWRHEQGQQSVLL